VAPPRVQVVAMATSPAQVRTETVAESILHVLDLPGDATIPELVIRPR